MQEARQGGSSAPLKKSQPKPAFKRGFIDDAHAAKKKEKEEQSKEATNVQHDSFVMPGLDGDSDGEEEEQPTQDSVDVPWAPSISLETRAFLTSLD